MRKIALAATALFAIAVSVMGFMHAAHYFRTGNGPALPSDSIFLLRGIDISAHNGEEIDFNRVSDAGYSFVIIKATEGTDFKDRNFVDNIRRAREAGLKVGAYHFFRFDTDGELQAVNFMQSLRGRSLDLPPAIDVEKWGNPDGNATSQIVGRLRKMIKRLEHFGIKPVIYANKESYDKLIRGNFPDYPLWICTFSQPSADMDWHIWQYSHKGHVDGVRGTVDLNTIKEDFLR